MIKMRNLHRQYEAMKAEIDAAMIDVAASGEYVMGNAVEELETLLALYVGVNHCVACSNGTDALSMALMALNVGEGDAVFVPDFTFYATAEAVARQGATPVFVDVYADTFNMSVVDLEAKITAVSAEGRLAPAAVIVVDLFGQTADYERIVPLCRRHGMLIVEDGAQGFGGSIGGRRACSFGDISTTSFFPSKPLGCYGDGGALFTDNDEWAGLLRSLRMHGRGNDKYDNVHVGLNSRLDTMQAAVLKVKMNHFDREQQRVGEIAKHYSERLALSRGLFVPTVNGKPAWAQYTVRVPDGLRERVRMHLLNKGIATAVYYPRTMSQQRAFAHLQQVPCRNAAMLCNEVLSIPIDPYMTEEEVSTVVDAFAEICK